MSKTALTTVEYEASDGIARIFLNRPERLNAVVQPLVEDLCLAFDRAAQEGSRAVILGGRGRAFCSGYDLKEDGPLLTEVERRQRLHRTQDVTRKIRHAPYVVIAAVQGYALGAGCEFALCTDLVIAADDAVFGFPEVEVGLSVTGGISHVLPITVGLAKAKELVLLGRRFSAVEAAQMGLVNRVVKANALSETADQLAVELCSRPQQALLLAKALLDRGPQSDIEAALEMEITVALALTGSADAIRAANAFRARSEARR